jgi:hypothetical protein
MYRLSKYGVIRLSDGACIPNDPKNRDYAEYSEWINAGNIPDPINEKTDYRLDRRRKYDEYGATIDALVIAMFEKDSEEIERLQKIRQAVKQEIRKDNG